MNWTTVITNLLKVKSIVTILTTSTFVVLLLCGAPVPQEFIMIYTSIIAFYFGTQTQKNQELYDKQVQQVDDGTDN